MGWTNGEIVAGGDSEGDLLSRAVGVFARELTSVVFVGSAGGSSTLGFAGSEATFDVEL